jgi:hypothetical protein
MGSEVPQVALLPARGPAESFVRSTAPGSEVAGGPRRDRRPIRRGPPQPESCSSAGRESTAGTKEIEMNEYEVICKGTVVIGSLQSDVSAVRS